MTPQAARRGLYDLGERPFRDRLLLQLGAEDAPAARRLLAQADGWRAPTFPLSGEAIKAAGVPQGPDVGRVRREVEAWWVAHDFPRDPDALAAVLRAAAAARTPS